MERRRAAVLAGHHGDEEAAQIGWADPAPSVRAGALGALHRLGRLRPDTLEAALGDPSPVVRRRACELATDRPGLVVPLLTDADPTVVEAAAFSLGEAGDLAAPAVAGNGGAVAALARVATEHGDPLCREAAVAALGAIGDPAGLPAVLAATGDKPAVRRRAVLALAPFEGPEVDAALDTALTDRDWQVRQAAEDLTERP